MSNSNPPTTPPEEVELDKIVILFEGQVRNLESRNRDASIDSEAFYLQLKEREAEAKQALLSCLEAYADKARIDELENFKLPKYDHTKCPHIGDSCIGYENARSDFDNEKELRLSALRKVNKGE